MAPTSSTTRFQLTILCQRSTVSFDSDCNVFENRCATSPTLPSPTLGSLPLGGCGVNWWLPDMRLIVCLSLTNANLRGATGRDHDLPFDHAVALRFILVKNVKIFPIAMQICERIKKTGMDFWFDLTLLENCSKHASSISTLQFIYDYIIYNLKSVQYNKE